MGVFAEYNSELDTSWRLSDEQLVALEERVGRIKKIVTSLPSRLANGDTILPSIWRQIISRENCDENIKSTMAKGRRKATLMQWGDAMVDIGAEARFADEFFEKFGAHVVDTHGKQTTLTTRSLPLVTTDPDMPRFPQRGDFDFEVNDGSALLMSDKFDWPMLLVAQTALEGVQLTLNGAAISRPELRSSLELRPELEVVVR